MQPIDRVRELYERHPYPPRDPAAEHQRLVETVGDQLDWISHFGFQGHARFDETFRILVAGGGTGDSTIYLAEQLRETGATVVYVDLSDRSMAIARDRAKARGLKNIEWIRHSLLELDELDLAPFDYINCCGVLHHLADPAAGLGCLQRALKPDGLLYLMVYGQAAREPVYQMQKMLRLMSPTDLPIQDRIEHAVRMLNQLPDSNLFKQTFAQWEHDISCFGEAGLADLLLHPQDRAYSVNELHQLISEFGMEIVEFVGAGWMGPIGYDPNLLIDDPVLYAQLDLQPLAHRQAIAELLHGRQIKHQCYVARDRRGVASPRDTAAVPVLTGLLSGRGNQVGMKLSDGHPHTVKFTVDGMGLQIEIPGTVLMREVFLAMNGQRTLQQIHEHILQRLPDVTYDAFMHDFRPVYDDLHRAGLIMLSDRDLTARSAQRNAAPGLAQADSAS